MHQRHPPTARPLRERSHDGSDGGSPRGSARGDGPSSGVRRTSLRVDQAVDGPGRVPDASTRQRPRGVQPHRLGLQHATRDQSRGTSRRGSRLNPYFARFQGDNQPESGRQAIAAVPHATDTTDAPTDRRRHREPATVLKPRCCRISDPRLGLFTRPGPFATHGQKRLQASAAVCRIPCLILCLAYVERAQARQCRARARGRHARMAAQPNHPLAQIREFTTVVWPLKPLCPAHARSGWRGRGCAASWPRRRAHARGCTP